MSLHEEITTAIQREIDAMGGAIALSPTSLAIAVQRTYSQEIEPHVQYTSLEHLKQIARSVLSRRFDADADESDAYQGDMFAGQLQPRYPTPRAHGGEPVYKVREHLSAAELAWNIAQLRKSAAARLEHADALQAWADGRATEPAKAA